MSNPGFMNLYLGINYTHHWKSMFKKANDQIFQKLATRSKIGFTVMAKTNLRVSFTKYRTVTSALESTACVTLV